jgi:hypothetical protein
MKVQETSAKVLVRGAVHYTVPAFQRRYEWRERELQIEHIFPSSLELAGKKAICRN